MSLWVAGLDTSCFIRAIKASSAEDETLQGRNIQKPRVLCSPHQALDMKVPLQRYRLSERVYCEHPAAPEYGDGDQVRKVQDQRRMTWRGRDWRVGKAFIGERVAVRADATLDSVHEVFWSTWRIARIDLRAMTVSSGRILE